MDTDGTSAKATDIVQLAEKYGKIRGLDHKTPLQLLRELNAEIRRIVLPCLGSIENRSSSVSAAVSGVVERTISTDMGATDSTMEGFGQLENNARTISKEIEDIERRLSALPTDSAVRPELVRALGLREVELDFTARKIEECYQTINRSVEQIKRLIPPLEDVQAKVAGVRRRFRGERLRASCWSVLAEIIFLLPTLIALSTTLICDRATQFAEAVTKAWLPQRYHDVVLLVFFAFQVPLLTPVVSRLSDTLCWRAFDRALHSLRMLTPEIQAVEMRITEAECRIVQISKGRI